MKSPPILVYASQNKKIINNELLNFNSEYCISIVLKNAISRRDFARHRFAFERSGFWTVRVPYTGEDFAFTKENSQNYPYDHNSDSQMNVLAEQAVLFSIFNVLSCRFLKSVSTMYKQGLRIYQNRETTNRKREKSI